MVTCDYNGWNDAPEEEREWFDQHPEIWDASVRNKAEVRAMRAPQRHESGRFQGGMAA